MINYVINISSCVDNSGIGIRENLSPFPIQQDVLTQNNNKFTSKKWRLSYVTLISKIWRLAGFSAQLANWDVFKSKLKYIILWMSELFTLSPLNRENKEMSKNILYLFLPYELFYINFTKWSKVFLLQHDNWRGQHVKRSFFRVMQNYI